MPDPRIEQYAQLLVERCIDVQPEQQVMIWTSPLARPLLEEVVRCIARRGAYALTRMSYASVGNIWVNEAPEALVGKLSPIEQYSYEQAGALINISAPENTRDGSDISPSRKVLQGQASQVIRDRINDEAFPWVTCVYPTPALAQDAGMTLSRYEDFVFGACLLDWDEEGRKMRRLADRFDAADEVRIVGADTDLRLSLQGRVALVDDGHKNMPGGEFFYSPVEDSANGVISYSEFPAVYGGYEVEGVRLVFEGGRVVEATARRNEEFLLKMLDADPGARVLGELGIGCNPGIQQHMENVLFDEKIYGTIHLAVGNGFPFIGGKNRSNVHWDMVKDLRQGGQIFCDGELVQENGVWQF
ncbi:MAG: aminopeptidase [Chloroflexi bacterium]|nr:MAG: aminopeptidase [Chloroflexota bacterium]